MSEQIGNTLLQSGVVMMTLATGCDFRSSRTGFQARQGPRRRLDPRSHAPFLVVLTVFSEHVLAAMVL